MGFKFIGVRHLRKTCIKRTAAQVPLTIMVITYYGHICIVKNLCTKRTLQKGRMIFVHFVIISVCLERQWTEPEMSVRCGAVKSNSGKAVFATVVARCWLRGC